MLWQPLRQFHDSVLVVTADGFDDRHENVTRELGAGNFEFVYGVNKATTSKEEMEERGIYDERRAVELDRGSKPMTLGAICCSIGHRKAYEQFLDTSGRRCLIFEDDIRLNASSDEQLARALANAPQDADLIYWGWDIGGYRPRLGVLKQAVYHISHSLGFLKYNHTMIRNLYARPYNDQFDIAGKHLLAHAYTVTRRGAEVLVKWNTPIVLNADNAIMYAILNGDIRGYISRTQFCRQRSIDPTDRMPTLQ